MMFFRTYRVLLVALASLVCALILMESIQTKIAKVGLNNITNVAADFTSQQQTLDGDRAELLKSLLEDWETENAASLRLEIKSYDGRDPQTDETPIIGQLTYGKGFRETADMSFIDNQRLLSENSGVVMVYAETDYKSRGPLFFWRRSTLSETYLSKPRRSSSVTFDPKIMRYTSIAPD